MANNVSVIPTWASAPADPRAGSFPRTVPFSIPPFLSL